MSGRPAARPPGLKWGFTERQALCMVGFAASVAAEICLVRLRRVGVAPPGALIVWPLAIWWIFDCVLRSVRRPSGAVGADRAWPAVPLVGAALVLSFAGLLTRLTLGATGPSLWTQPLVDGAGVVALVAAMELSAAAGRKSRRALALGFSVASAGLILLEYSARPRLMSESRILASRANWPMPLLVLALLGLLAAALAPGEPAGTGPPARAVRAAIGRLADLGPARTLLPVFLALGVFAFTRDLAVAVTALAGGLAVWQRADRPGRSGLALGLVLAFAVFFLGAVFIVALGKRLGYPGLSFGAAVGARQPRPRLGLTVEDSLFGPGFALRYAGPGSGGPDILVVIGRETGLAGLAAVGLLLALLIGLLAGQVTRIRHPMAAGWANGLVWFVGVQALLPTLALLRLLPDLGLGPPLLSDGAAWYVANLLAVGLVLGLARRGGGAGRAGPVRTPLS